ncbi:bifunctional 2-polyprenyl-6-hydroxyphenol methylase/3-demethylubiquinol 3-O-methyltransferase UbiG [Frankia sp. CiP3]|uniref:class I SAM-dependent methyltransferase n=1 Tax=Frankia sp. CiP3 TaxID=2880971 RepID=UPI001EF73524|nr:class I SAM-dependent methyltransferase [Frankia sp. CiP3]
MKFKSHRSAAQPIDSVQVGNRDWWTNNPMTYDWHGMSSSEPMSREWFDEMDRRWIEASFPFLSKRRPFDQIMPDSLDGKRVLEIGCGMGLHTEELITRGADVTAVDLTETAVTATKSRLAVKGLTARVQQADAEELPFGAGEFDFVWSWGVIHHSSRTTRIVRQIARALSAQGEARVMVYNRDALVTKILLARYYIIGLEFRHRSADEVLWEHTDGFMARYFHREQFEDLGRGFFEEARTSVLGQESDVIPLPRQLRRHVSGWLSNERRVAAAAKRGTFLFTIARNPLSR